MPAATAEIAHTKERRSAGSRPLRWTAVSQLGGSRRPSGSPAAKLSTDSSSAFSRNATRPSNRRLSSATSMAESTSAPCHQSATRYIAEAPKAPCERHQEHHLALRLGWPSRHRACLSCLEPLDGPPDQPVSRPALQLVGGDLEASRRQALDQLCRCRPTVSPHRRTSLTMSRTAAAKGGQRTQRPCGLMDRSCRLPLQSHGSEFTTAALAAAPAATHLCLRTVQVPPCAGRHRGGPVPCDGCCYTPCVPLRSMTLRNLVSSIAVRLPPCPVPGHGPIVFMRRSITPERLLDYRWPRRIQAIRKTLPEHLHDAPPLGTARSGFWVVTAEIEGIPIAYAWAVPSAGDATGAVHRGGCGAPLSSASGRRATGLLIEVAEWMAELGRPHLTIYPITGSQWVTKAGFKPVGHGTYAADASAVLRIGG